MPPPYRWRDCRGHGEGGGFSLPARRWHPICAGCVDGWRDVVRKGGRCAVGGLEAFALTAIPVWGQFVELLRAILSLLIGLTGSPGLAIILFTVAIRALLVPLTVRAHRANR